MIQFNLLPDVKLEYIKARRTKRLVVLASTIVAAVSLAIAVVLFVGTTFVQRQHLNHLNDDIHESSKKLEDEPDLGKILTVQNQLNKLEGLHRAKPAAERLGTYLSQLTPSEITISDLEVDFAAGAMVIEGSAPQLKAINEFIDTLKFTKYKEGDQTENAFSNVILAAFTRNDEDAQAPATYQITLSYNPIIFDNTKTITLEVPSTTTNRSTIERPQPLFQAQEQNEGGTE